MRRWNRSACILALLGTFQLAACDRVPTAAPARSAPASANLTAIASAVAGTAAALVPASDGNAWLVQPDARETVFRLDCRSGRLESLDLAAKVRGQLHLEPNARPSIRALAPLANNRLAFYVSGTSGKRSLAGLWTMRADGSLELIADFDALAGATGFGDSLDLADAKMVATDRGTWLCLYYTDAAVFFLLQPTIGPGAVLHPTIASLRNESAEASSFRMTPADRLFSTGDGLGLLKSDGQVLHIADDGRITAEPSPAGGKASCPPLKATIQNQAVSIGFRTSDDFAPPQPGSATARIRYPAIVISPAGGTGAPMILDSDAISLRPGFPIHALRIEAWGQDTTSGDIIAYDAFSGEIMRLAIQIP